MNEIIIHFIQQQTCATICCSDEHGKPYCFTCFYAFNSKKGLLYFKSSTGSHHAAFLKINPFVAGTILPDKLNTLIVKGVQFDGIVLDADHPLTVQAFAYYYKQFPMALAIAGDIRVIQINHIKMTDSTMGFGKKIIWDRGE